MAKLKKIVIIGPESTGKSTLCTLLAKHYNTVWCAEYAREYLTEFGAEYTYEDLLTIAKGQVALEERVIVNRESSIVKEGGVDSPLSIVHSEGRAKGLNTEICTNEAVALNKSAICNPQSPIFIDTDLYVMKVWCEFVFNKCHTNILEQIAERKYDLYLLCNIDLPWSDDPLREYPDEKPRQELYRIYKDILINQHTPWVEISGDYEQRLQTALKAVDKLLEV